MLLSGNEKMTDSVKNSQVMVEWMLYRFTVDDNSMTVILQELLVG